MHLYLPNKVAMYIRVNEQINKQKRSKSKKEKITCNRHLHMPQQQQQQNLFIRVCFSATTFVVK